MSQREEDMDEPVADALAIVAGAILAVENAPLPLVVAAPDGRVRMANRALRELLGYGSTDLAGREVWDFAADVDMARARWQELLDAGETRERPFELVRQDGSRVQARASSIVVTEDDGTPRWIISRAVAV
jgi:PAS domain S-box-containing protein